MGNHLMTCTYFPDLARVEDDLSFVFKDATSASSSATRAWSFVIVSEIHVASWTDKGRSGYE